MDGWLLSQSLGVLKVTDLSPDTKEVSGPEYCRICLVQEVDGCRYAEYSPANEFSGLDTIAVKWNAAQNNKLK